MNMKLIGLAGASLLTTGAVFAADLETEDQKLSYIFGLDIGTSLARQDIDVDLDAFHQAVIDSYNGTAPAISPEEAQTIREAYIARRNAEAQIQAEQMAANNAAEGAAFLAENAGAEGVQVTESGLQYKVVTMGDGPKPAATDRVTVHYRGALLDGTEFDSSYGRNQPASFALNQVIPGWTEGVQLMPVGSKFTFWIPSELAYGSGGTPNGPIGPNATLMFDVELISIDS